jgi:pilus assembly protein FimV
MIITCRNCNTSFNLSDELLKDTGSKVKCSKCNYIFKVFPPHIQNEPDQNDDDPGFEEGQQKVEEKSFLPKPDADRDWDLSEIEKILQGENGKIFDAGLLESTEHQEEYDDFELDELDDLFGKEEVADDQKKEKDFSVSGKGADSERIPPEKTAIEDLDLSELDDFFKEDGEWEEKLPEFDADSNILELESDIEKEKTLNFLESEDVEEIEDIDLSALDDLFREDKISPLQTSESLKNPETITEDDDEEISFIEASDKKTEEINLSEIDEFIINEIDDDDLDSNLEIETKDNNKTEQVSEKIEGDIDFDFDLGIDDDDLDSNLEIETKDNDKTEQVSEKIEGDIDFDFDLDIDDDDPDSNLEIETKDNNTTEQVSEKIEDDIDFDFDLEMEKDSSDDLEDANSSEDFKIDFEFAEKDQDQLQEIESADINDGLEDDKNGLIGAEKSATEKLNLEDNEKKDNATEFEEFDLSDLEEIIDLEEESGINTKSLKPKDEEQEIEFDLALEPDNDEDTSIKVVLDGEELYVDAPEKAVETESEYPEKIEETDFEFEMAENLEEDSLKENDDYNLEETQGKFQKVFDTVTLIDSTRQDERDDDDIDIEDEPAEPKSRLGKMIALAILIFILLASAGYGVFSVFNMTSSQIPIIGSYLNKETSDPGNIKMVAVDLNSKFEENQHAGKIFIITGIIKNEYPEPRSFIKVTGKLYEPTQKLSHTEQVYAGNMFSELELRNLDLEAIKNRLSNRLGQNKSNVKIGPGQSVPFVIIFSNLPQQLEEFTVEIESSSPA